jgi:N-acetylglucosamine kinase-like BadF-type ATPase
MPGYLIGVDGGGTKTAVHLAALDGSLLGRGVATSSNYQKVGFKSATTAILEAIAAAFAQAALPEEPPAAIVLGLAGVDTESDRSRFVDWLARTLPTSRSDVVNDAELALAAGTPDGIGVALICGTGAIAVGRNAAGEMARADGWGYLLGDDGSGFSIGQNAMRHVLRALDGRGPATALTDAILTHWSLPTPEALLDYIYLQEASPATIASLAAVVNGCAEAGDAVALDILRLAGGEVAQTIHAVVRRLGLNEPGGSAPCALAGSVVTRSRLVQGFLLEAAAAHNLRLGPVTPVTEPVVGAVRLAQRLLVGG